ncbi:hypothetical protein FRC02_011601 [Tulasnella sp. 418]|nr:hypothetical protein FRC02_011601 [Tulasnella sp. 418]
MIRAPDSFVYPAPFNLIEIVLVAPFEPFVSKATFAKINRVVMSCVFFVPLTLIALFEAFVDTSKGWYMRNMYDHVEDGEEDDPSVQNPKVDDEGLEICRVSFDELRQSFPNTRQSPEATILSEIQSLSEKIQTLTTMLEELKASK